MAARPLQPSEYEIQREVEALKDLRRRSTTPGALTIDPDLPNQSPPASPTSQYRSTKSLANVVGVAQGPSSTSIPRGSSSDHGQDPEDGRNPDLPNNPADDPFHLFWVPAGLHPEIAPQEFRAFLKEHARSPNTDGSSSERSTSPSSLSTSSSLGRKKSMLSRQYKPKEDDEIEEENIVPLKRNRSLLYPTNPGPQLTISDLQRLEELAEEASQSDDTTRLRSVLRRSLSLNLSPTAIDLMDDMPDMGDEADVPIIVPPPGQILRRTARTKIRKQGMQGDGGGVRFQSRRGAGKMPPTSASSIPEPRTSSEVSSSDHGDTEPPAAIRRYAISDEGPQTTRPDSYSEETSIIDSYIEDDDIPDSQPSSAGTIPITEESPPLVIEDTPPPPAEVIPRPPVEHKPPIAPVPVIHQPQAQRPAAPLSAAEPTQTVRTPSPAEPTYERSPVIQPPPFLNQAPPPQQKKDKKGLFKWGGDKGSKKNGKDREGKDRTSEKEKDSGFSFGSLFGKKKQESEYQSSLTGGTSGRETAQALLGASKSSKNYVPPSSPGLAPGLGGNPYARYPIHVERAIYRLSHIKLANPRRPLYEQVLISNLMFWYLGIINKAQTPTTPTSPSANGNANNKTAEEMEKEANEKEQRERVEREKAEKERLERERQEREQREKEAEMKKKESGRRGSLTKTPAGGPMAGGRRAEMPVKGPQYEMQHRVMEQEYGGYNGQPPRNPNPQMPPANGGPNQYQRGSQPMPYNNSQPPTKQPMPPQSRGPVDPYHHPGAESQSRGLPPGAMAPLDQLGWGPQPMQGPPHSHPQRHPSPDSARRSQSPPSQGPPPMNMHKLNTSQESLGERLPPGVQQRTPGRSLSATASSVVPQVNGVGLRKGNSAHAVSSYDNRRPRTAEGKPQSPEEEDLPLAVWQQQRRK
ncbi:hypothetical protein CVT24_001486 [Panaeolus cyanescens]|uniref:Protein Zds1 C-terminal domain-containing protein n=1 Tax=Panaeolus cyanescens TaxID=181874 RepID=A0A409VT54_9AGAR|nr:hypothetical protein CVT24_001486 [Panaeolus cyanescens]